MATERKAFGKLRLGRLAFLLGAVLGMACSAAAQEALPAPARPMNLSDLIAMGMDRQPALIAARASLSAAASGQQGIDNLRFLSLLSRDIPIRREQAGLGVTIAAAGLEHQEWETRYAVTRNFYSIQYARMQLDLVRDLVKSLEEARDRAQRLAKAGDPSIKVTQLDVDSLTLNLEIVRTKEAEAAVGILKAMAALREAIGVGPECPLEVAAAPLPAIVPALDKDALIAQALARRGELVQALAALEVTHLEVTAQSRLFLAPSTKTFAAASDVHAKPIPQGVANGEYRPGAIGLEMPNFLVGCRSTRMQRAQDLSTRAQAVVEKTQNLIALEVEATYLKWFEAKQKVGNLDRAVKLSGDFYRNIRERFNEGKVSGGDFIQAQALRDQTRATLNEALYNHALALSALERVTAGGYVLPTARVEE